MVADLPPKSPAKAQRAPTPRVNAHETISEYERRPVTASPRASTARFDWSRDAQNLQDNIDANTSSIFDLNERVTALENPRNKKARRDLLKE